MRKRELYRISLKGGKILFEDLSQGEYFERMEDLSIEFYQTGIPTPDDIITDVYVKEDD